MEEKKGKIKISSENMMPIIKKWLYSDKDIFLREIVANGVDAITKLKKLCEMGEATVKDTDYKILVKADAKAKTLTIEDNGIGMTADEVEKYITQIAFSGAEDFLEKYKNTSGDGIIGHFGLGFYSCYMVAENVEIETKSYKDEPAVHWESDGNSSYTISDCDKKERGTKIILHIAKDEEEFLKDATIKTLLEKYCSFMPYPVYYDFKGKDDKPVNNTTPLYLKDPKDCTDEEYKTFYRDTFMDYSEPLFWIHLNMDYPFRLKGILYFPKIKNKLQLEKGQVKLYCNQVYIADNIKEVIPEFLMLLNGVIDCPDIPLNVSRSFLQNDSQVQKISKHITKKVADKLTSLFKNDRKKYEECWKDISQFIKFGCIKDNDFYDKVKDIVIFKNLNGEYTTLSDAYPVSEGDDKKEPTTVYYVSDVVKQAQYIKLFKDADLPALVADDYLDPHFISFVEYKNPTAYKFARIDSDLAGALKEESTLSEDDTKKIVAIFEGVLKDKGVQIKTEALKDKKTPAIFNSDEFLRRMSEMNKFYGMEEGDVLKNASLVLNLSNSVVLSVKDADKEKQEKTVLAIYYLALLSFKQLTESELNTFVELSSYLLEEYVK